MSQPWCSVIDAELSSANDIIMKDMVSAYPELTKMCQDIIASEQSEIRPALTILAYYANGGRDPELAVAAATAFEMLVQGELLHDRIGSDGNVLGVKKGLFSKSPSTTKVIVAGDFMFSMGFRQAYTQCKNIVPYLMEASSCIGSGNFIAADLERKLDITEEECLSIIDHKSGRLYAEIVKVGCGLADPEHRYEDAFGEYGYNIGMALKIKEDVNDIYGDRETEARFVALLEGRISLPIYYALQDASVSDKIKPFLEKTKFTRRDLFQFRMLMVSNDAGFKSEQVRKEYAKKAFESLKDVPSSEYTEALLQLARNLSV